ncbi:hypothetical protein WZ342_1750 [Enterococcus faecalis]|nr:hypothetical protein WZ342_1750 [Enterococcus faecalis]
MFIQFCTLLIRFWIRSMNDCYTLSKTVIRLPLTQTKNWLRG